MRTFFFTTMLVIFLTAASPVFSAAMEPGTADYLRQELKYTDQQLTTPFSTEEREPFNYITGVGTQNDPAGDVLSRYGTTTSVRAGWADITLASLTKNTANKTWDVHLKTAEPIPKNPGMKFQVFLIFDSDESSENNETEGYRADMDTQFMLRFNPDDNGWYTDFRWYNHETDFWAYNKETRSHFEMNGNIAYQIPFEELSSDLTPKWRVVTAVQNDTGIQIDAASTIGFPQPKQSNDAGADKASEQKTSLLTKIKKKVDNLALPHYLLIVSTAIAGGYVAWLMRNRSER